MTRLGLFGQVAVLTLLGVVLAGVLLHLAEQNALRLRVDLTLGRRNTLDPQTERLLDSLPAMVRADVFFENVAPPFGAVVMESQLRVMELLRVAESYRPDRLEVVFHDATELASTRQRMDELGIREQQTVVLSQGHARHVLRLFADLVEIDPGQPDPRQFVPPTLVRFFAEEALAEGLAAVSSGEAVRLYLTTGRGELSVEDGGGRGAAQLRAALESEGFEVATWDPREGPLPQDCQVLALLGPEQPLDGQALDAVQRWVEGGGRLFATTGDIFYQGPGSAGELLSRFGLVVNRARICEPVLDPFTGQLWEEVQECLDIRVGASGMDARHPITAPLVENNQQLRFLGARSFDRPISSPGRTMLQLATSGEYSWRDVPDGLGTFNYKLDLGREEAGRQLLAMSVLLDVEAGSVGGAESAVGEADPQGRVVALAGREFAADTLFPTNRMFLLNAFNWLAEQDLRIRIPPRDPGRTTIDVLRGSELSAVSRVVLWGLPGACLLVGALSWWWRRRG